MIGCARVRIGVAKIFVGSTMTSISSICVWMSTVYCLLTLTGIMPYSTMRRVNPSPRLMIGRLKNLTHGLMGIGMTRPRKNAGNGTTM